MKKMVTLSIAALMSTATLGMAAPAAAQNGYYDRDGYSSYYSGYDRDDRRYDRRDYRRDNRRDYRNDRRYYRGDRRNYRQCDKGTGGTVIGAIVGAALGNTVGDGDGRRAATVAGAVAGGAIGHNIAQRRAEAEARGCQLVEVEREQRQVVGYDVEYMYKGEKYMSLLPYDPGNRLRIRVSVTPDDGATAAR